MIITAADAGYFHLLRGLIQSVRDHLPSSESFAFGVIDVGLEPQQIDTLRGLVDAIVPGRWDFDFAASRHVPRWLQATAARPRLREYFPGFETYIWMDADTWLADWRAVELLADELTEDIAIVPELHCAYPYLYRTGKGSTRFFNRDRAAESFGPDAALLLDGKPFLNAGVFAMPHHSPVWEGWRRWLERGFRQSPNKWTDQNALNLAIYSQGTIVRPLPAWCNWICSHVMPVFDSGRKCLCEPCRPYEKLSLIHTTGLARPGVTIPTIDHKSVPYPLDYLGFQQAITEAV